MKIVLVCFSLLASTMTASAILLSGYSLGFLTGSSGSDFLLDPSSGKLSAM